MAVLLEHGLCKWPFHTIFLSDDGVVYSCGRTFFGQLGLGHRNKVSFPSPICNLPKIMQVSCGGRLQLV